MEILPNVNSWYTYTYAYTHGHIYKYDHIYIYADINECAQTRGHTNGCTDRQADRRVGMETEMKGAIKTGRQGSK